MAVDASYVDRTVDTRPGETPVPGSWYHAEPFHWPATHTFNIIMAMPDFHDLVRGYPFHSARCSDLTMPGYTQFASEDYRIGIAAKRTKPAGQRAFSILDVQVGAHSAEDLKDFLSADTPLSRQLNALHESCEGWPRAVVKPDTQGFLHSP